MSKGETKTDTINSPNAENDSILAYLSTRLIYPVAADDTPPYERIAWWKIIFSYLGIKKREQLELRWMCRIFRDALPCLPLWTLFPHPIYQTLKGLADRVNHLGNDYVDCEAADMSIGLKVYRDYTITYGNPDFNRLTYEDHTITEINPDGTYNITEEDNVSLANLKQKVIHILPSLLFIADGTHDESGEVIVIKIPISIIGESREHCIVIGGLKMTGKQEDEIDVSDLTLRDSKGNGVCGWDGASFHLDNVSVENSEGCGVIVFDTQRSTMKSCNVSHSKSSGICVDGGLMTIDGNGTTIHHNCTRGDSGDYGLEVYTSTSSLHLAASLTIEMISTNNVGGGDYGGQGTIAIVDNDGTIIKTIQEATD